MWEKRLSMATFPSAQQCVIRTFISERPTHVCTSHAALITALLWNPQENMMTFTFDSYFLCLRVMFRDLLMRFIQVNRTFDLVYSMCNKISPLLAQGDSSLLLWLLLLQFSPLQPVKTVVHCWNTLYRFECLMNLYQPRPFTFDIKII